MSSSASRRRGRSRAATSRPARCGATSRSASCANQIQIYQGRIDSLRRFKEDVRQVKDGYECGISIENYNDIKVGDVIECYEVVEVARTLSGAPAG